MADEALKRKSYERTPEIREKNRLATIASVEKDPTILQHRHKPRTKFSVLCGCGCGEMTKRGSKYLHGHYTRIKSYLPKWEDTPENHDRRKAISRKTLENNPNFHITRMRNVNKSVGSKRPTKIEVILRDMLSCMYGPDLISPNFSILKYTIDCAIPSLKLAFEADGWYWHNKPGAKEKDLIRDEQINNEGWKVIRFSEKQLMGWKF